LYREKTPSTIKKEMEELENMVCHKWRQVSKEKIEEEFEG
jgi:hypothetical protein